MDLKSAKPVKKIENNFTLTFRFYIYVFKAVKKEISLGEKLEKLNQQNK